MILLKRSENNVTQEALIGFERPSAARTALMLSNAMIADHTIQVTPYDNGSLNLEKSEDIDSKQDAPKTSKTQQVMAEIYAAGYLLSNNVIKSAKTVDDKVGVSAKLKQVTEKAKVGIESLDEKLHIKEKAKEGYNSFQKTASDFDHRLKVTETVEKAMNSEPAKKISGFFSTLAQTVYENVNVVKDEGMKIVSEKGI
ncbi:hypothetical protein ROZALSC1DRAFT_26509 [Rozella allomycis CSF55]|uniref:Uncharacterized protein n=1 Tax=Rozella allomycis (strain CSF55) TaxID=988480 RepID=A0A075B045_ROZAC|nr:hypothetical protein O9G_003873 [Rozella allomycis CSF55]RKP22126.1 hypothetical protein ROZALSC1DRAFT_26509 [Rozella allomycis CSF55]|eukprot:EPZ35958.1 hypothetical protein O9G_003873 [Rozella allomycis CSF55]